MAGEDGLAIARRSCSNQRGRHEPVADNRDILAVRFQRAMSQLDRVRGLFQKIDQRLEAGHRGQRPEAGLGHDFRTNDQPSARMTGMPLQRQSLTTLEPSMVRSFLIVEIVAIRPDLMSKRLGRDMKRAEGTALQDHRVPLSDQPPHFARVR